MKKEKIKKFVKASVVGLLGASLLFSAPLYYNSQVNEYHSLNDVNSYVDELDGNLSYFTESALGNVRIFPHNNGEPVYVSIPSNADENTKNAITSSLDYVFGIMHFINDNYSYKIVDKSELKKQEFLGKSTINFERIDGPIKDYEDAMGTATPKLDPSSFFTMYRIADNFEIKYNAQMIESVYQNDRVRQYIFTHELFHVFSLDDVYNRDVINANTYMNTEVGPRAEILFPNDLKCLMAIYAPKFNNKEQEKEFLSNMKSFIAEYETEFYKEMIRAEERPFSANIDSDEFKLVVKNQVVYEREPFDYYYTIEVKDGRYKFTIFDSENKFIDTASGDAMLLDGVYILKDVNLKYGLGYNIEKTKRGANTYGGLYTDLRLQKYKRISSEKKYSLLISNNYTIQEHCGVEYSEGLDFSINADNAKTNSAEIEPER